MARKLLIPEGGFTASDLLSNDNLFKAVGDKIVTGNRNQGIIISCLHGYSPNLVTRNLAATPNGVTGVFLIEKPKGNSYIDNGEFVPLVPKVKGQQLVRIVIERQK